jgi:hypothetical protein
MNKPCNSEKSMKQAVKLAKTLQGLDTCEIATCSKCHFYMERGGACSIMAVRQRLLSWDGVRHSNGVGSW